MHSLQDKQVDFLHPSEHPKHSTPSESLYGDISVDKHPIELLKTIAGLQDEHPGIKQLLVVISDK